MELNADQCYQAVLTRDARFDGRFFVAVRTTGIYCRPICRVKTPLRKNCTFFAHAAAAESAGYRPCKRCRPELAPGASLMEVTRTLARRAAFHIGEGYLTGHCLADLARKLGVTDRQMRRVFFEEFGVTPVEFWQTQRLLLAKQLLTDSHLPVTSVAMASGFKSLRRFNALLKARYRMSPSELRRQQAPAAQSASFAFRVGYRPPLDWPRLLAFLRARAIPGVETVRDDAYCRTISLQHRGKGMTGHIEVFHQPKSHALAVRVSETLLPASAIILERVRRLFDLYADPIRIGQALHSLAQARPGLRVPGSFDGFETAVRAVLGQQISVAGATTLAGRLAERLGTPVATPLPCLTRGFPAPQRLAAASLREFTTLGITAARASTLIHLAKSIARGDLLLEPGHALEATLDQLQAIPGIGGWTAQYIAMRALAWPDAFPHTDLGIRKRLGETNPAKILQLAEQWRPWRAYAAIHLWTHQEDRT